MDIITDLHVHTCRVASVRSNHRTKSLALHVTFYLLTVSLRSVFLRKAVARLFPLDLSEQMVNCLTSVIVQPSRPKIETIFNLFEQARHRFDTHDVYKRPVPFPSSLHSPSSRSPQTKMESERRKAPAVYWLERSTGSWEIFLGTISSVFFSFSWRMERFLFHQITCHDADIRLPNALMNLQ